jgi:isoleucyl-tRNA synthetase
MALLSLLVVTAAWVAPAGRAAASPAWLRVPRAASRAGPPPVAMAKKGKKAEEEAGLYSNTVSLPETSFSQRAMAVTREPELQQFWKEQRVYEELASTNPGESFVLHDGPPYANGDLHIGHALNKILKDIINKYQLVQGRKARFVPGWDCHGLPIELKVLQSMSSSEREGLTPIELRKRAAAFALETVGRQKQAFQRWGVWGDWDAPYLTLQPEYEAAQLGVFGQMFLKGHIYRGRKPVHWSPSSRTALAEAELEYPPKHVSTSIYVGFEVTSPSAALASLAADGPPVRLAIWTTTPWTIPANMAVAVNEQLEYALVGHPALPHRLLVATELKASLAKRVEGLPEGAVLETVGTISGADLAGTKYRHPLAGRECAVVVGGDYITTESGTGLVHTAPGHGQEDYQTGLKYGLELLSPVDDAGLFTVEAGEAFVGKSVLGDGNVAVIHALRACGALLAQEAYEHKYPYDWRTKKPTIFRATSQWFASVDGFRSEALAAIEATEWLPAVGKNRITAMTQSRSDWCISRQRTWGVPIPVFYDRATEEPLLNAETLAHVQALVTKHGTDIWWTATEAQLLPEPYAAEADRCASRLVCYVSPCLVLSWSPISTRSGLSDNDYKPAS